MKRLTVLLEEIAKLANYSTSKQDAIKNNRSHYLHLEFSSHYGGYRLVKVGIENGGHSGVFGGSGSETRRKLKEMDAYLTGILAGLEFKHF